MQRLLPTLDQVSQEYLLVQAWKKTASYIRYHNWFSDTLELDRAAASLPNFIAKLSDQLRSGDYETSKIKLVPAPKSQPWKVGQNGRWQPDAAKKAKLRPLAHVALTDQVAATAIMLCLSDRVETAQGDPRKDFRSPNVRQSVMSYGNRLFCDSFNGGDSLVHRWGSAKLYRAYFQDYRSFLNRPESIAADIDGKNRDVYIFQTDLKQFYDRVTPEVLHTKINRLQRPNDDKRFFDLAKNVMSWEWVRSDQHQFRLYKERAEIPMFDGVALPQGLVAAGFFSNIVMLDFDQMVLENLGQEIAPGIRLNDSCRYVDDIRLTISAAPDISHSDVQKHVMVWIDQQLTNHRAGLQISPEKTTMASVGGQEQPLARRSRKMERIQSAISGGFDASGGEEIIQAIEALVRSQVTLGNSVEIREPLALKVVPDVTDQTIGRFAAGRFRKTFRSLRPLLDDRTFEDMSESGNEAYRRARLSQAELDEEAHVFALMLIDRWISDPSNVRLLRVALDLWPSPQILAEILKLIEPYLSGEIRAYSTRRVAFYCLAEILRAGATETGFIEDQESFPANVDLAGYRNLLLETALRIVKPNGAELPWYLVQQALLFIAVHDPAQIPPTKYRKTNWRYWRLIAFLNGNHEKLSEGAFANHAIVCRRSLLSKDAAVELVGPSLTAGRFNEIAIRDIEFSRDLYSAFGSKVTVPKGIAADIGIPSDLNSSEKDTLRKLVQADGSLNALRNEIGVLSFAKTFLEEVKNGKVPPIITPSTVEVSTEKLFAYANVKAIKFTAFPVSKAYKSIYSAPAWADESQHWRFQLGYLLRFILTARVDFSLPVLPSSWRETEPLYRPTRGHWFQRQYGFYNGHEAFGDDWLPISQFTQDLLFTLLSWPGCRKSGLTEDELSLEEAVSYVEEAFSSALETIGPATGMLMLKVDAPMPGTRKNGRPLRACVVQSIMPEVADFSSSDLEMRAPHIRLKHRRHLSTALAAVEKMLDLRETHKPENKRLDWLILPELSIHPDDVRTHLVPFARAFKTAILAGVVYDRIIPGEPLVNSALWIIPREVAGQGLQTIIRRQGKQHLSPVELPFNDPVEQIMGFRPCQWLIGYEWSPDTTKDPLWLSASICYDATDLKLASDLRDQSDVLAIPALNSDVGTFDQMAQALHYHMFQHVVVANNGAYGGSNAYVPKGASYERQVFHTHGQPQATISFFEIDDIEDVKDRRKRGLEKQAGWKYPPAGG